MKPIIISTRSHREMRYFTLGDYYETSNARMIDVLDLGNEPVELGIAIHELIEEYLTRSRGISEEEISAWDKAHLDAEDPGSLPGCPYLREHEFASIIERIFLHEIGD